MLRILSAVFVMTLIAHSAVADMAMPSYPYVVACEDGTHYFKMLPATKDRWAWDSQGTGLLYEVGEKGKDKLLWRVSGWYAFATFISNDGKYLVRMGNTAPKEPSKEHLAVAFYENGNLIKRYSTVDLLKDSKNVRRSVSFYQWLRERPTGLYKETEMFTLITVENIRYTFDVKSGNVLFEEKVDPSTLSILITSPWFPTQCIRGAGSGCAMSGDIKRK